MDALFVFASPASLSGLPCGHPVQQLSLDGDEVRPAPLGPDRVDQVYQDLLARVLEETLGSSLLSGRAGAGVRAAAVGSPSPCDEQALHVASVSTTITRPTPELLRRSVAAGAPPSHPPDVTRFVFDLARCCVTRVELCARVNRLVKLQRSDSEVRSPGEGNSPATSSNGLRTARVLRVFAIVLVEPEAAGSSQPSPFQCSQDLQPLLVLDEAGNLDRMHGMPPFRNFMKPAESILEQVVDVETFSISPDDADIAAELGSGNRSLPSPWCLSVDPVSFVLTPISLDFLRSSIFFDTWCEPMDFAQGVQSRTPALDEDSESRLSRAATCHHAPALSPCCVCPRCAPSQERSAIAEMIREAQKRCRERRKSPRPSTRTVDDAAPEADVEFVVRWHREVLGSIRRQRGGHLWTSLGSLSAAVEDMLGGRANGESTTGTAAGFPSSLFDGVGQPPSASSWPAIPRCSETVNASHPCSEPGRVAGRAAAPADGAQLHDYLQSEIQRQLAQATASRLPPFAGNARAAGSDTGAADVRGATDDEVPEEAASDGTCAETLGLEDFIRNLARPCDTQNVCFASRPAHATVDIAEVATVEAQRECSGRHPCLESIDPLGRCEMADYVAYVLARKDASEHPRPSATGPPHSSLERHTTLLGVRRPCPLPEPYRTTLRDIVQSFLANDTSAGSNLQPAVHGGSSEAALDALIYEIVGRHAAALRNTMRYLSRGCHSPLPIGTGAVKRPRSWSPDRDVQWLEEPYSAAAVAEMMVHATAEVNQCLRAMAKRDADESVDSERGLHIPSHDPSPEAGSPPWPDSSCSTTSFMVDSESVTWSATEGSESEVPPSSPTGFASTSASLGVQSPLGSRDPSDAPSRAPYHAAVSELDVMRRFVRASMVRASLCNGESRAKPELGLDDNGTRHLHPQLLQRHLAFLLTALDWAMPVVETQSRAITPEAPACDTVRLGQSEPIHLIGGEHAPSSAACRSARPHSYRILERFCEAMEAVTLVANAAACGAEASIAARWVDIWHSLDARAS